MMYIHKFVVLIINYEIDSFKTNIYIYINTIL